MSHPAPNPLPEPHAEAALVAASHTRRRVKQALQIVKVLAYFALVLVGVRILKEIFLEISSYGALTHELHLHGAALAKSHKLLRTAYHVLLGGVTLSAATFALCLALGARI